MFYELLTDALLIEIHWRSELDLEPYPEALTLLGHFPDLSRTFPARPPQIKILPDDSPACLGSLLFRLTRNKAGATELVPLLMATDGH